MTPTAPPPANSYSESQFNYAATPNKKKSTTLVTLVIIVLLLALGTAAYLGYQRWQEQTDSSSRVSPPSASDNSQVVDPSAGWQSYRVDQVGLEFKLPPELSKYGDMTVQKIPGDKGNQLCLTFPSKSSGIIQTVYAGGAPCGVNHFGFGTTSSDFEAGRSAGFTDLQGYKKTGSTYQAILASKSFDIPGDIAQEVTTDNGLTILKVHGKRYQDAEPFVQEGNIGALINTYDATYPGLAVQMTLENGVTEKTFDDILSTFIFHKAPSDAPTWIVYADGTASFEYPSDWTKTEGVVQSDSPKISVTVVPKHNTLMNECMQLTATEQKGTLTIQRFARVTTGAMCQTTDATPREIWVTPGKDAKSPGISYKYSVTDEARALQIFDHILSTFAFTQQ